MEFQFNVNKKIPRLAWLAKVEQGNNTVSVIVGRSVETTPKFFVSGAWAGDFNSGDFSSSDLLACTGGCTNKSKNGGVVFSSPLHLQEILYAVRMPCSFVISNSLAFLLSFLNLDLDTSYYDYEKDLCSILWGTIRRKKSIPLKNDYKVELYSCSNIEVDSQCNVNVNLRKSNFDFADFNSYLIQLQTQIRLLGRNANDPSRMHGGFGSIASISQGYDAPASAVLARELGCKDVVTLTDDPNDDGSLVANAIGYNIVHHMSGNDYKSNTSCLEAASCASGSFGGSVAFIADKALFRDKIFVMGDRGDSVWERNNPNANNDFDFTFGNGLSQSGLVDIEFAIENRTLFLFPPLIGADHWIRIADISKSKQMMPWRVREHYDRPIARRIIEDAGAPRDCFGREKHGGGIAYHFDTPRRLAYKMSPSSFRSFMTFRKELKKHTIKRFVASIKYFYGEYPAYVNYACAKAGLGIIRLKTKTSYHSSPLSQELFLWGINEMKKRYQPYI